MALAAVAETLQGPSVFFVGGNAVYCTQSAWEPSRVSLGRTGWGHPFSWGVGARGFPHSTHARFRVVSYIALSRFVLRGHQGDPRSTLANCFANLGSKPGSLPEWIAPCAMCDYAMARGIGRVRISACSF